MMKMMLSLKGGDKIIFLDICIGRVIKIIIIIIIIYKTTTFVSRSLKKKKPALQKRTDLKETMKIEENVCICVCVELILCH